MLFLPVNDVSFLIELTDLAKTLALFDALSNAKLAGVVEIVPAARTLLIAFEPSLTNSRILQSAISAMKPSKQREVGEQCVEIPVVYNGEDLDDIARLLKLTREEIVRRHTESDYTVAFTGFAPGFAYLSGGDPIFDVPRRQSPRTVIPAGSVALAGRFSGIYPQASPGGWQLLGVTDVKMFDLERQPPALLQPGMRVKFVDAATRQNPVRVSGTQLQKPKQAPVAKSTEEQYRIAGFEVLSTLMPAFFEDQGRPLQAAQGLSPSGALDQSAMANANRLVGNDSQSCILEITFGQITLKALDAAVVAFTGASCPMTIDTDSGVRLDVAKNKPVAVEKGDRLTIGSASVGFRCYMAVRGGFDVPMVLGSASRDTLANLGPEPVVQSSLLYIRRDKHCAPVELESSDAFLMPAAGDTVVLDIVLGPRTNWFTDEAIRLLREQPWCVSAQTSRVGMRLKGERPLGRAITDELPSEGTVTGAIQVPANGQPVLFMRDRPLTGGYPVIGNVARHHLDLAAQIPVGCFIRFNPLNRFAKNSLNL